MEKRYALETAQGKIADSATPTQLKSILEGERNDINKR
jgi:hypothetical protein